MKRLIVGLLMVLLTSCDGRKTSIPAFNQLKSILQWCDKLVVRGLSYTVGTSILLDSTRRNFERNVADVEQASKHLKSIQTFIDRGIDNILNAMIDSVRDDIIVQIGRTRLNNYMNDIEIFHNKAMEFEKRKIFGKNILKKYVISVLWSTNNLPNALNHIYEIIHPSPRHIIPSLIEMIIKNAQDNLENDCNSYMSAQQRMYYFYIHIFLAEMKGLTTLAYVYSIQQVFDKTYNYTIDLDDSKLTYKRRIWNYFKKLHDIMAALPQEIHRCDVDPKKRDVDFIEMYKFSRATLLNEQYLTSDQKKYYAQMGTCRYSCSDFKIDKFGTDAMTSGKYIYDCQYFGGKVRACLASSESHREYLWWQSADGIFGHKNNCSKIVDKYGFIEQYMHLGVPGAINRCDICLCSVDMIGNGNKYADKTAIGSISVSAQISDITNNMVVTGVKFVVYDNAIHLQIQENRFFQGALIHKSARWKHLTKKYCKGSICHDKKLMYVGLNHKIKSIQLDNIMVPDNYAVTGVRFTLDASTLRFSLSVYATPFDIVTGSLTQSGSKWFTHNDQSFDSIWTRDYERDRHEIKLVAPDDPTQCKSYSYDIETNKFIKFIHTDVRKDAGQNTVPYFDAQPVETVPSFPLSGIGLYYKGKDGCGGYVSPRIYTIDLSKYILKGPKKFQKQFKRKLKNWME